MIQKILSRNKKIFIEYNRFRKRIFSEFSPQESETVLYLLPWLLSVNHPDCPGYMSGLKRPFRVFNIGNDNEILKRESLFKRKFGVKKEDSLLKAPSKYCLIQGLYTIGSIGTVSQTSGSDCDIWVCYDKKDFNRTTWLQLTQKVNLIKDWLDINLKMPVFFFLSDVTDIKNSVFGSVDSESSGSSQKNVLKEEFYRTCMVICGKIPLWWICFDENIPIDYQQAISMIEDPMYGQYDLIDFGNLERVSKNEYFGAALWQLHKSLTHPLKSIIKITLLKMLLDAPSENLICHQFREQVLSFGQRRDPFPDPSVFAMLSILDYYQSRKEKDRLTFLKECFYLRCEIKPYDRRQIWKKQLTHDFLKKYPIDLKKRIHLSKFDSWDFNSQIDLGNQLFKLLLTGYREIASAHKGMVSEIDKQDMTVLGRKILVSYQNKKDKVAVLHKPADPLNLSSLTFSLDGKIWNIFSGSEKTHPITSGTDIVSVIAFIVWNNLFVSSRIYMEPNPSSITLQEIMNLGTRMRDFFGNYDVSGVKFSHFLRSEVITKFMVVVSFEKSLWDKDTNDFGLVYKNSWDELFVKRFFSPDSLKEFLANSRKENGTVETSLYVQRNSSSYEKIIERVKKILSPFT